MKDLYLMMTDLFSSLDGARFLSTWAMSAVFVMFFTCSMYSGQVNKWVSSLISSALLSNSFNFYLKLNLGIFTLIMSWNLLGLVPVVYSETCHLWVGMSMGLTMWATFLISGCVYNYRYSFASLVPSGAPMALAPLLVLIETVSLLIRPLTLTIRLVANITAGHVVLGLILTSISSISLGGAFTLLVGIGYTLFEVFVGLIQAYIFTLLISMYSLEHS